MPNNNQQNEYQVASGGFGGNPSASPWEFPTNYGGAFTVPQYQGSSGYGNTPWNVPSGYGQSSYPSTYQSSGGYGSAYNSPWSVPSGNVPSTWQGDMSTWGGGPSPWSDLGFGSFQDLIRYAQAQRENAFRSKMSIQDIYEEKNRRLQTYLQEQREAEEMKRLMKQLEAQKYAQMLQFMQGMAGGGW